MEIENKFSPSSFGNGKILVPCRIVLVPGRAGTARLAMYKSGYRVGFFSYQYLLPLFFKEYRVGFFSYQSFLKNTESGSSPTSIE
jgi:hypothetical protein